MPIVALALLALTGLVAPDERRPPIDHGCRLDHNLAELAAMRQAIELYRMQHEGRWPDGRVVQQLSGTTDVRGEPGTKYGPYVRAGLPMVQPARSRSMTLVDTMPAVPRATGGWLYAPATGELRLDLIGDGPDGTPWFEL